MKFFKNFDLTNYNSYKINAKCKMAYFPENENDIIEFFKIKEPYVIIGSGHNIIFSKSYYDCNFLIFNGNFDHYEVKSNELIAESGISMFDLSNIALENALSGIEIFYDIPSSLGGAVVMNAGASGEEIKDVIIKVRYLDLEDLSINEKTNDEIGFEFRNSFFQKNTNKIVLKVWLKLNKSDREIIKSKMESIKEARWSKQPKNMPNAGSVFKRPKGFYVGAMIDDLNLKGFSIGGAMISKKHGGFIVNYNNALGSDIINIINEVKKKVLEKFDVELEVEQRII